MFWEHNNSKFYNLFHNEHKIDEFIHPHSQKAFLAVAFNNIYSLWMTKFRITMVYSLSYGRNFNKSMFICHFHAPPYR